MRLLRPHSVVVLSAALAGCSEVSLRAQVNVPPTVEIVSHKDGDALFAGALLELRGTVSDNEPIERLDTAWWAGEDLLEECDDPGGDDGITNCALVAPDVEELRIRLEAQDDDGSFASDIVDLVIHPNAAPVAKIEDPAVNGSYYANVPIVFRGRVTDAEDDETDLVAGWDSNADGALPLDATPDGLGDVLDEGLLSEGTHTVTLTGRDTVGRVGTTFVVIDVKPPNNVPECAIDGPSDGGRVPLGSPVTFAATVSDVEMASETLTVTWESDVDGVLDQTPPDTSGHVEFTSADLSRGPHAVTLSVGDEVGTLCTSTVSLVVSGPPTVTLQDPATGLYTQGEAMRFRATVDDEEDPEPDLLIAWTSDRDGPFDNRPANASGVVDFTYGGLSAGVHEITVSATDTDGLVAQDQVQILVDGPPSQPVVVITPNGPRTNDDLVATLTTPSVDPEGAVVLYRYEWRVDGVLSPVTGASVPRLGTTKGQTWQVFVTPSDGTQDGSAGSDSVVVENTPPTATGTSITPDPADTADILTTINTGWADADGDPEGYRYAWVVDGFPSGSNAALPPASSGRGSQIQVTVTPFDGEDSGTPLVDTIGVTNGVPTIGSVVVSPSTLYTDDDAFATPVGWADVDGDPEGYRFAWYVNGGLQAGQSQDNLSGAFFARGDRVWATATPFDGIVLGTTVLSNQIIVSNTVPSLVSVSLAPNPPAQGRNIVAVPAGWSDADGDLEAYQFSWDVSGRTVVTAGPTLQDFEFQAGDVIVATLTPFDGLQTGTPVSSSATTVASEPPTAPDVEITPSTPEDTDDLRCDVIAPATDPEGDPLTYSFSWTQDGAAVAPANTLTTSWPGDTIDSSRTSPDQEWVCTAVANDGFSDGPPDSDTVTIAIPKAVQVSTGSDHACLLDSRGWVECWGSPTNGRLVYGYYEALDAGESHTCVIDSAGAVSCVGRDGGDGRTITSGLTGTYVEVSAGVDTSCVIDVAGEVTCIGSDLWGQADTSGLTSPPYHSVSAGLRHGCALEADGSGACWGDDQFGRATPPGGTRFERISAGVYHTCGLDLNNLVHCWGRNLYGESIAPGGTFVDVSAGESLTCGVRSDGTLSCWGYLTAVGELNAPPPGRYVAVSVGTGAPEPPVCAAATTGAVVCWGNNTDGEGNPPYPWW